MTIRVPLRARFEGGVAADGKLPLYDGTASIQGIAQAVQIAMHALLTETIVTRATAARGAEFFLLPSRPGSFLVELAALIEANPAVAGLSGPIVYDWLKMIFTKATSRRTPEPDTARVRRWLDRDELFLDELAETLEGSLQRVHRPIGMEVTSITFERPRSRLITLDVDTKAWVNTRDVAAAASEFTGNVTRFNSITRNGRAYIDQLRRVVPFKPDDDFIMNGLQYLTWSLHGSANNLAKRLTINAREVNSATGETKRLLLVDCLRNE